MRHLAYHPPGGKVKDPLHSEAHKRPVPQSRGACRFAAEAGSAPRKRTARIKNVTPNQPGLPPKLPIPGVKYLIAVGSGKGGVGKTTVSVNLAVGLAALGYRTGLMDADVYGPNVPLMMGINQPPMALGDRIQPLDQYGVKLMSMGFLNPGDKPLIWRGPMLHSVVQQFLRGVDWGELDYLVIDLPPGTGDVQLSLIQTAPITGAVVVTTPSDVSLEDARKAVAMFNQVKVPILGLVENMSYLVCPHCDQRIDVFSHGGGKRTAEEMGVSFLAELPLDPKVRIGGDTGDPIVLHKAEGAAFLELARATAARALEADAETGPSIEIGE
jgi:ATP-binding protein involved in chromosome partitioning